MFAGPFSLPAAQAVGADSPDQGQATVPGLVLDTLRSLVDSSLVQADPRGGEPRFALLETIRDYARERLAGGGGWVPAHDRHAAYFLALAEPAAAEFAGPEQLTWLDRLETEHDDLLAAMSWLVDQGPPERALHLFSATWKFWWLRGHAAEFAHVGEQIVASSERLPPDQRTIEAGRLSGPRGVRGRRGAGRVRPGEHRGSDTNKLTRGRHQPGASRPRLLLSPRTGVGTPALCALAPTGSSTVAQR